MGSVLNGASMKIKITINGTDTNPHLRYGLIQNPFPQIAKAEYNWLDTAINSLAGDPVKDVADIRRRLRGCSEEFINLVCNKYVPGEKVTFYCALGSMLT
jgi:hypothetical protein